MMKCGASHRKQSGVAAEPTTERGAVQQEPRVYDGGGEKDGQQAQAAVEQGDGGELGAASVDGRAADQFGQGVRAGGDDGDAEHGAECDHAGQDGPAVGQRPASGLVGHGG